MTELKNILTGKNISFQEIVDAIKALFAYIFGFITEDQGWADAE